jgi:hypothetical protein
VGVTNHEKDENVESTEPRDFPFRTNRPKSKRSTGPRSRQGKDISRQNAVKHGIFSRIVVMQGESRTEFSALMNGFCDYFQPVGTFEENLVETLATTRWRQRRLLIAEGAEIEAGRAFLVWDEKQRQLVEARRISQVFCIGGLVWQRANPEALRRSLDLLAQLRDAIEQNNFNSDNDEDILAILYGDFDDNDWRRTLFNSYQLWSKIANAGNGVGDPTPEECKERFLGELADEIKLLERFGEERASTEANRMKLESLRRSVPDSPRLDGLLRYGAGLDRLFDHTLSQLERYQRMRRDQPVAPEINVNVCS